jgi:uncharacterized 2Fe-2S/4Fe-4S cluster protein (DUF4445 family)
LGDVRIDVPPDSQLHQQVVRKEYEVHPIDLDPVIRLYFRYLSRISSTRMATCSV